MSAKDIIIEPSQIARRNSGPEFKERVLSHSSSASPLPASLANITSNGKAYRAVPGGTSLARFSLQGEAAHLESQVQDAAPILGSFIMPGQSTIIYAAPNTGKTLITLCFALQAISNGRIRPEDLYYINADDNQSGLAMKARLLEDAGAHTIAPGFKNFKAGDLIGVLRHMASTGEAHGLCVIIDTLKKFTQLMDKKLSSDFADACRQFSMHGGTIVALAHTTKNPNPDGSVRYTGTTDFVEDFDAVYVVTPLSAPADAGEKVVRFDMRKRRGDSPETVAYAYAAESGISYEERVLSVRPVDLDQLDALRRVSQQVDDAAVVSQIKQFIGDGWGDGKMALAKATAKACSVSERAAINILDRYTGPEAQWTFRTGDRGKRLFELVTPD